MNVLEVGKPYLPVANKGEGVIFDIDEGGATLIYNFANPSQSEIAQMHSTTPFEIRFVEIEGLIWILSKCGNLNWTDAPYDPHLSPIKEFFDIESGKGLALTLIMTDADTAVVKSLRLIGLGERFSRELMAAATRLREQQFDVKRYNSAINSVYSQYSTKQMVDRSRFYCKIR